MADPDLRSRVTVVEDDLLAARLPDTISAVVLMNVLGHFSPADRTRLWALVAARLARTGRVVLNLLEPLTAQTVPATAMAEVTVGGRCYTGTVRAEPAGPDVITWHMTYRVHQADQQVHTLTASNLWHVLTPEQLAVEIRPHGLRIDGGSAPALHVLTR